MANRTLMKGMDYFEETGVKAWGVKVANVDVLRSALGNDLTVAFVRSFAVVDRLVTILDCMQMNYDVAGADGVRGNRNIHTLGLFAAGLIFELREAVRQLRDADVESRLSEDGKARWTKLVGMAELKNEDALRQIRNCLAFHPGDPEVVNAGLDLLAKEGKELVLFHGDGQRGLDVEHDGAVNIIMAGMTIRPADVPKGTPNSRRTLEGEDLEAAFGESSKLHFDVVKWLDEIFFDVLRNAGADVDPPGPLTDET